MDASHFEQIRGGLIATLVDVEDRLPEDTCRWVTEFIDAGEFGLALETIADVLAEGEAAITVEERNAMLDLVRDMSMDDRVERVLALCPVRTSE